MLEWKSNRRILIGISGGISAYKIPEIVRAIRKGGNDVEVIMTKAATSFVTPLTLSTLTGRRTWLEEDFLSDEQGWKIPHISLADWAQAFLVAPATANVLRRAALGEADTLLGATMIATRAPVIIFPAMNVHMWEHPATQRHVSMAREIVDAAGLAAVPTLQILSSQVTIRFMTFRNGPTGVSLLGPLISLIWKIYS